MIIGKRAFGELEMSERSKITLMVAPDNKLPEEVEVSRILNVHEQSQLASQTQIVQNSRSDQNTKDPFTTE